ncbi:ABC transporter permease [Haloplasma contractile]|uniref:FtsX-like permease protein n=1 Tax=Haloplasma contractile SSD-17B TaxID=1033810 RepID=F7PUC6_9MOLU|nr:FtsX-like permease family protein [Haloplasma contractile]ERJ11686.1 FtsX-like permease protein [Haloplasma contractile SSD-17B]
MKPLSLWNYIMISIKRVLPQIGILSIKIALFIFLCSIGFATAYGLNKDGTKLLDSYVSVAFKDHVTDTRKQMIIEEINQFNGVRESYNGTAITEGLGKLIIFNSFCWTFELEKEDVKIILKDLDGEIVEGRLPEHPEEMIISEELSRSLNKGVGDVVGFTEMLPNQYQISGIYSGNRNAYIGYHVPEEQIGHLFNVENRKIEDVYGELEKYENEIEILTFRDDIVHMIDNIFGLLKVVGIIILVITAIEITISVSNLNRVYFTERAGEFAVLQAVGYSEKFIRRRMMKEMMIITVTGLVFGIIIGQLSMVLFYYLYCYDKGIPYQIVEPTLIGFAILLTFVIYILSYIPVRKYIKNMDPVEVIQESNV